MTLLFKMDTDRTLIVQRIFAYMVDVTFLTVVVQGAQWGLFSLTNGFPFNQMSALNNGWLIYGWVFLTVSVPIWLYFIVQERSSSQATLGKRLFGLTVRSENGQAADLYQIIGRTIIKLLPWEIFHLTFMLPTPILNDPNPGFRPGFIVGFIVMFLYILMLIQTPRHQSVHDMITRTVVEKR